MGWEQRLVPFSLWWGGMIVWSETVGASTLNPVQRWLEITRCTTAKHAIQWKKRRRKEEDTKGQDRNKQKEKQWTNRKRFFKESLVTFQNVKAKAWLEGIRMGACLNSDEVKLGKMSLVVIIITFVSYQIFNEAQDGAPYCSDHLCFYCSSAFVMHEAKK